jgi:hypothetical protein
MTKSKKAKFPPPVEIAHAAWHEQGTALFGENEYLWRFVCPVCGHVQTPQDFVPFSKVGATAESVRKECLGRYKQPAKKAFPPEGYKAPVDHPCDYASYGLFNVSPVLVLLPDGQQISAFAFAPPEDRTEANPAR